MGILKWFLRWVLYQISVSTSQNTLLHHLKGIPQETYGLASKICLLKKAVYSWSFLNQLQKNGGDSQFGQVVMMRSMRKYHQTLTVAQARTEDPLCVGK